MKKTLLFSILTSLLSSISLNSFACTGGSYYGSISPTTTWQTTSGHTAGYYYTFSAVAGATYNFSYCTTEGGSASYDTELTILNSSGTELQYNDDYCNVQSFISWTCTSSGTYRVLTTEYGCYSNSTSATLAFARAGCLGSSQYPSGTQYANENPRPKLITDCNYAGEYYTVSLPEGHTYEFTSSNSTDYLVITDENNTTAFVEGTQPITGNTNNNTSPIVVNVHVFTNSSCGTSSVCRESRVTCTTCPVPEPTAVSSNNDFCAGEEIQLTASDTFGVVEWREGSCNGQLVGTGYQIDVTPDDDITYYVKNTYAGQNSSCYSLPIDVRESPVVPLEPTTILCTGFTVVLDAGNPGSTYLWFNGATTQTLTLGSGGNYWVQVTSEDGCTTEFNGAVIEDLCVGQEELANDQAVQVFPNPTKGELNVKWSGAEAPTGVALYSSTGQRVEVNPTPTNASVLQLDLNHLPKGIYMLTLSFEDNKTITQRVLLH